jgi:SAM-dependent methyltransferase
MKAILKEIEQLPDKQYRWKSTTSRKWKVDLVKFLSNKKVNAENTLEIGCNQGVTTYVLSKISKNVHAIEFVEHNIHAAKDFNKNNDNIKFVLGDAYIDKTYDGFPDHFDIVVIDCIHDYEHVIKDINRALTYCNPETGIYLVFDDYSHPACTGVRNAIDKSIEDGLTFEKYIGHGMGHIVNRNDGTFFKLIGSEGIILSYGK